MPTHKLEDGGWLHPSRLPLGGGWNGLCTAPGHEGSAPELNEIRESCNLGYALSCSRLPALRSFDAIRFGVSREGPSRIYLTFVCERDHLPGAHGTMEYDLAKAEWLAPHSDARIAKMAECYLQAHLNRRDFAGGSVSREFLPAEDAAPTMNP